MDDFDRAEEAESTANAEEQTEATPHAKRVRLKLTTADDICKEYQRLYRAMKAGNIPPADGTKLAFVLNLLRQAIETGDLAKRLELLEQAQKAQEGHRYG